MGSLAPHPHADDNIIRYTLLLAFRAYISIPVHVRPQRNFAMNVCAPPYCTVPTDSSLWIVDDDEDDRLFIRSAFQRAKKPIRVRILSDGDQLIPQLANCANLPRLILLDINMSRQNGFETLQQVRSTPTFAHLPVVMFTTSSDAADRQRSLALGANQYLTKPSRYEQLITLAEELTEQWALV